MRYNDQEDVLTDLKNSGYQITPQRKTIVQECLGRDGHFTASDIFSSCHSRRTEISRATLYNTLHLLVEQGFLRELTDMGDSSYYEVNQDHHPHGHCQKCGDLIDIPVDLEAEIQQWDLSFKVENIRMTLDGFCPDCSD